ncbi:type IV conjugative transfer system protein TraE [Photobacterium makurazakiensis]|uniref:type IV conjugative transfer system protein TraE n=1 Tax=Photobacterium makurazakiensis TaxID=2910234 RepID=UPI003D0F0443
MDTGNREIYAGISSGVNALLLIFVFALLLGISGLGWTSYYLATHKSRTITPPMISKAFTVSDANVDADYLSMMAEYFMYLRFNVTPSSVERKFYLLSEYANPSVWKNFSPVLSSEVTFIKEHNVSSTFDITSNQPDTDKFEVRIEGTLYKNVGIRPLPDENNTYIVKMSYQHGFIQLDYINKETSHKETE